MAKQLISNQTDAANSAKINIAQKISGTDPRYAFNSTFRITGGTLGVGEYVKLQYHDGTAYRDAIMNGNEGKILDEDNAVVTIYGIMTDMRLSKSITASALGVEVV